MQGTGNHITWSSNGEKFEIRWRGEFEFSDDDTDVKRMSPGSHIRISDGGWLRRRSAELTADASGNITRRYWVGSTERPFEPEGRQWLAEALPRFIRQSGMGAKSRVARIFKAQGAKGVLAEISRIEGSWARKLYYTELFRLDIDANARREALEQAGRDITSDYELASLLIDTADKFLSDAGTRNAYFAAAGSIQSDYEMGRVLKAGLKRGPLDTALLAPVLEAARGIDSDYELATLLIALVKGQSIETARPQFFAAVATIASDYEQRRVMTALSERADLSPETVAALLSSLSAIASDHEAATFLLGIAKRPVEGPLREPFFRAVDALKSSYERSRVLLAVAGQQALSNETVLAVLQSVRGITSGYEASRVLQALAARHSITGAARDAFIDATHKLGDYEQGRALTALAKSDRSK